MNYSPNIFTSQGHWYTLEITLVPDPDMFPDEKAIGLDGSGVEEFTYSSELNNLMLTGRIVYVDKYGEVDKLLEQQQCQCQVSFFQNKTQSDGTITDIQVENDKKFSHIFLIRNVKILNRQRSEITYEIDLISHLWYNCTANISFSNNDRDPQSLFGILKACIQDVGLATNDNSFERVLTDVRMNYIAQANDNLITVFHHLMDKLYFWTKKDNALKFLVYNWFKDQYMLLDISDKATFIGSSITTLSFFKSNAEQLVQETESNIGSYSNGLSKTDLYTSMFEKGVYQYDFSQNSFVMHEKASDEKTIVGYMNECMSSDDYQVKYHVVDMNKDLMHVDFSSYWNNSPNTYFDIVKSICSTGALTLNTSGDILRQCGYLMTLVVDRNMNALKNDSPEELKDVKMKYSGVEGTWIAFKVVSVICPKKNMFNQKIALFRNYTKTRKPPKEKQV